MRRWPKIDAIGCLLARRNNLANVHMNCFDDDAALGLYREALSGQRQVLGDSHPSTLLSAGNLGSLLLQVRHTHRALCHV